MILENTEGMCLDAVVLIGYEECAFKHVSEDMMKKLMCAKCRF